VSSLLRGVVLILFWFSVVLWARSVQASGSSLKERGRVKPASWGCAHSFLVFRRIVGALGPGVGVRDRPVGRSA